MINMDRSKLVKLESLDEICNHYDREHTLVIFFKGFTGLFKHRGYLRFDMVQNVKKEFIDFVKEKIGDKKDILLVWDGDDYGEDNFTHVLLLIVEEISKIYNVSLFTYWDDESDWAIKDKDGNIAPPMIDRLPSEVVKYYHCPYSKLGFSNQPDNIKEGCSELLKIYGKEKYIIVGMLGLYTIAHKSSDNVYVFCIGGGLTPFREYLYCKKDDLSDWLKQVNISNKDQEKYKVIEDFKDKKIHSDQVKMVDWIISNDPNTKYRLKEIQPSLSKKETSYFYEYFH